MTPETHMGGEPDRAAAGCYVTHRGSNAERSQWVAGPGIEAPAVEESLCSETTKCVHTKKGHVRDGLRGRNSCALLPTCWYAAAFGTSLAEPPAHGERAKLGNEK